jgi:arabinose-5-phosphate isomerase
VDPKGKLLGIFTDSDLARLLERNRDQQLDAKIESVMTARCAVAAAGSRLTEAIERMRQGQYSELPVVDAAHQALGMLDITDLLNLFGDQTPTNDFFGKGTSVASAAHPVGSLKLFTPPET